MGLNPDLACGTLWLSSCEFWKVADSSRDGKTLAMLLNSLESDRFISYLLLEMDKLIIMHSKNSFVRRSK